MMSLEEIIKALTKCDGNCGGGCEFSGAYGCNVMFVLKGDILHHLKDYRQTIKYLEVQHDHVEQLCEYSKNNPPLTWDELLQMQGKPVYVVFDHINGEQDGIWAIVNSFMTMSSGRRMIHLSEMLIDVESYGTKWKAYRREK